jgi:hypothetical protein
MGSTLRPQERIAFSVGEPVTSAVPPSYRQENILTWMTLFGMTGEFHWKYLQLYAKKYKQREMYHTVPLAKTQLLLCFVQFLQ